MQNILQKEALCDAKNAPDLFCRPGSAPDPSRAAQNAPPDPLVGWKEKCPIHIFHSLNVYSASFSAPAAPNFELEKGTNLLQDLGG